MTDNISGIMSSDIGVNRGCVMTGKPIDLDPNQLLGLCQVMKVAGEQTDERMNARLLSKNGGGEIPDGGNGSAAGGEQRNASLFARLLSKIGEESEIISDARLKRDIEQLATRPDGLPIYAFKYLWDDQVHVGVMAQDLLQNEVWRPAVLTKPHGYFAVDYGRLGLRMTTLDEWQARNMAALTLGN